jgi:hypothetical protein
MQEHFSNPRKIATMTSIIVVCNHPIVVVDCCMPIDKWCLVKLIKIFQNSFDIM